MKVNNIEVLIKQIEQQEELSDFTKNFLLEKTELKKVIVSKSEKIWAFYFITDEVINNELINYLKDKIEKVFPYSIIVSFENISDFNERQFTTSQAVEAVPVSVIPEKVIIPSETLENSQKQIQENVVVSVSNTDVVSLNKTENIVIRDMKNIESYNLSTKNDIKHLMAFGEEMQMCDVEGVIFDKEMRVTKNRKYLFTFKITDYTDSMYVTSWGNSEDDFNDLKVGVWVNIRGVLKQDTYKIGHPFVLNLHEYKTFKIIPKTDGAVEKRVELHAHTKMSQLDGVVSAKELVKKAIDYGHKAIAITDHAIVHSFPDAYYTANKNKDIKILFGCELNIVNYKNTLVFYENEKKENVFYQDATFVVFDIETTGLHQNFNKIIEMAAVKVKNGLNVDTFESFVNPNERLSDFISELTGITDEDLTSAPQIKEMMDSFLDWIGYDRNTNNGNNIVLVAHNAPFDVPFLKSVYRQLYNEELNISFLDTLAMARYMYPEIKRHGLKAMAKKFSVQLVEHHRAIYDTEATVNVFLGMMNEYISRFKKISFDLKAMNTDLITEERQNQIDYSYHTIALAKNQIGLKNLFKLVSTSHVDYFTSEARIPAHILEEHKEGILFGSACERGELFNLFLTRSEKELREEMKKYDYIEVQPPHNYEPLIYNGTFKNKYELTQALTSFINIALSENKKVVATGDVHQLDQKSTIIRDMYIRTNKMHYLNKVDSIPAMYLLTTDEMKQAFSFLEDEKLIHEIVVTNSNLIADEIESIKVIKDELFTPKMDNVEDNVKNLVWGNVDKIYKHNNVIPEIVKSRTEKELDSIIKHGFAVIYYICHLIIKKSLDDGYIVGSRGSVGSSLVATLMDVTEVNPLPPHYVCPSCNYSEFFTKGEIASGFDLADKACPSCNSLMKKDGHDIPFETFLGFEGDKVPDIDLNFSGDYQSQAHDYTKVLFGEDKVYRAGTISTIAEKTAYGYVRGYLNEHPDIVKSPIEIDRLTLETSGVKKTTGRHAGGVIVVPDYMDIYDITPVQYPADGKTGKDWKTTHFDFHAIHDNLLKLDLLGHDDPTIIRMLQDLSGIAPKDIPLDDKKVYSLFSSVESLNLEKPINVELGSLGIPEFGTHFVQQMLEKTRPSTFAELVQISGLSHGTDVWSNNAEKLVENGTCELKDVIGCRDDIMVYLIHKGLEPNDAFKIMEIVRKGNFTSENVDYIQKMKQYNVPQWYIDSCIKIKYMFPKAHATAYVMSAMRIAWFKVHKPLYFYASLFSVREKGTSFEIKEILAGYDIVKARIEELTLLQKLDPKLMTTKDKDTKDILQLVLEMLARGYSFEKINLYKSDATKFLVNEENKTLMFPLQAIEGLGENVAKKIVEEAAIDEFLSKEDLRKRTKVTKTVISKLEVLGILDDLPDQNQMSLF